MSRKMLINASEPEEIRVAIIEGSILEEYYVERMSVESVLGNIYKGRITNVEPSIGAAFVDFGGARHGFLHISDVMEESLFDEKGMTVRRDEEAPTRKKATAKGRSRKGDRPEDNGDVDAADADREADAAPDDDAADDGAEDAAERAVELVNGAEDPESGDAADEPEADDPGPDEPEAVDLAGDDADLDADPEDRGADEVIPDESDVDLNVEPDPDEAASERGSGADEEDSEPLEAEAESPPKGSRSTRGKKKAGGRPKASAGRGGNSRSSGQPVQEKKRKLRSIQDFLKKGQEVVVQVTKDGIGTKGPTLTTYISLPGRYLVLMPGLDRKGVSRKIDDGKERDRLKKVLTQLDTRDGLGFIVRTAGVGQTQRALQKDYRYLTQLWERVEKNVAKGKAATLLYRESDLVIRTIRDIYGPDMGDIIIDDEDVARRAREFLAMVVPRAVPNIKLYNGERPLFSAYGIEDEIGRLFMHRVELSSGGSLVVEQTEALVAIDVNSGRFREEEDLEETAYKINIEAASAIARQLRLRDLGGVIVVDFIDMRSEKRRRGVERAFRGALKDDRARIKVARMSPFGVIELTRQRVRASLRQSIFQRCPTCRGAGYVATSETLELNLVRQLKLMLARRNAGLEVFLNPDNAEYLINHKREALLDLEREARKPVMVKIEPELQNDEFRIVPLEGKTSGNR